MQDINLDPVSVLKYCDLKTSFRELLMILQLSNTDSIREDVKYYFADFVRKGGEGYPPNPNLLFRQKFVRKGGGGGTPISVTYFLDQKQVFFGQKTPFLALFEEHFSGECP